MLFRKDLVTKDNIAAICICVVGREIDTEQENVVKLENSINQGDDFKDKEVCTQKELHSPKLPHKLVRIAERDTTFVKETFSLELLAEKLKCHLKCRRLQSLPSVRRGCAE